ncbi:MAG: OFA family MFS transporter [Deltaproteobacteria bacterium]|nr:OFA family MFS transporter [Deltaproteobacteria bacterium]
MKKNRWLVVLGALIIQISLGAVYIYSVFKTPLQQMFGWDKSQVALPAQIILASFAIAMIFAGRVQDKIGPRVVATAGGIVLGAGLILASLTQKMGGLSWFVTTFSVIGGIGVGITYVCPISACVKWFPDKRGLITGLAVAGFGAGGLVFAPIAKSLIESHNVMYTMLALGIIFLVTIIIGAQFLSAPPADWKPENWQAAAGSTAAPQKKDYSWREMLATPQFYLLWLAYFAGCTAGLMIIMNASTIWQSFAANQKIVGSVLDSTVFDTIKTAGATSVSLIAIFNAIGRIAWGKISDSMGSRIKTLIIMFAICSASMLFLNRLTTYPLFIIGTGLIGFCFGGFLALYPAVTADFYGTKNVGANYGIMFTAYGAGGLLGPWLQARLVEKGLTIGILKEGAQAATFDIINYKTAFVVSGIMCIVAVLFKLLTKAPKLKNI